ncbi:protein of unknown function [Aminobacter niigataensis]|nr:protein of unknown function [Aminobacter niigataensis]
MTVAPRMVRKLAGNVPSLDSLAFFLSTAHKFRDEFHSERPTGTPLAAQTIPEANTRQRSAPPGAFWFGSQSQRHYLSVRHRLAERREVECLNRCKSDLDRSSTA